MRRSHLLQELCGSVPTHTVEARDDPTIVWQTRLQSSLAWSPVLGLLLSWIAAAHVCAQGSIRLVSVSSSGAQGDFSSGSPSLSATGRVVAFMSFAGNFAAGDSNGGPDIYVRDLDRGQTAWASMLPDGSAGYFGSQWPTLSADGRFVAFYSPDSLVPGGIGFGNIFVRDLEASTTSQATVGFTGSQPNGDSYPCTLSANGRYVAFLSLATNLVPHDANGGSFTLGRDVFVRDLVAGLTELIDVDSSGSQGNASSIAMAISGDGQFVAFSSGASNLVLDDNNGQPDVFVHDRLLRQTIRVSVDSSGSEANHASGFGTVGTSADGRYVLFDSQASNLVAGDTNGQFDIFLHDCQTGVTTRASIGTGGIQANDISWEGAISADGRYAAFVSPATNLVPGDSTLLWPDVFVRDMWKGITRRVSINATGAQANAMSSTPTFSGDGQFLAYASVASNLVPGDLNGWHDVFLIRHKDLSPSSYCSATPNSQGCRPMLGWSGTPSASASSAFDLSAANLVPRRNGTLLYATSGPATLPFHGGVLCVGLPLSRTESLNSQGSEPCSGSIAYDFNARIASGIDPALIVGRSVWTQYWSRDPRSPSLLNLSDAVFFVIDP